ncbi:MAG: MerR family transcriptional regulator [Bacilli bacterium]|nr:MerR family transcriptional regulator [Bacilli bacterium]
MYKTSQIASLIGVHPNTIRLYEKLLLIPKPERLKNSYRVFTSFHVEQCKLIRLAFQIEILQNGLRKKMISVVKASANKEFDLALVLINEYINLVEKEIKEAEEAIKIVTYLVNKNDDNHSIFLKRKEISNLLDISIDTLRNWEMNGLIKIKRKENGYRIYDDNDINKLKIIKVLRLASYSLESILRLLNTLEKDPNVDILTTLNTPRENDEIVSVCDRLIISLNHAKENAHIIKSMIINMKEKYL